MNDKPKANIIEKAEEQPKPKVAFQLPNRTVELVPIIRRREFMGRNDHDGLFMFTGCSQSFVLPMNEITGRLINPLNEEERLLLEDMLGFNLDINKRGNYFESFRVMIKKTSENLNNLKRKLQLNDPIDYLSYKVLLKCGNVANSWEDRNKTPEYEWALRDEDQEVEEKLTYATKKRKAYQWLETITSNTDKMLNALLYLGYKYDRNEKRDKLEVKIAEVIEDRKGLDTIMDMLADETRVEKSYVLNAIRIGEMQRVGANRILLPDGTVVGRNMNEAIAFWRDPENSMIVERIKEKLKV